MSKLQCDSSSETKLDELVAEYIKRTDQGEAADVVSEELLEKCPSELKLDLAERLDDINKHKALRGTPGRAEVVLDPDATKSHAPNVGVSPLDPGANFAKFKILKKLGGGMADVYKARQLNPDRVVALKVMRSADLENVRGQARQDAINRFKREVAATVQLPHANIVQVYEADAWLGKLYFSMEYIDGKSLKQLLDENGPFEGKQAAKGMEAIARALHYAHSKSVIHRDVKPSNIQIDEEHDTPKLIDFGLAKWIGVASDLTCSGAPLGTAMYAAPEQIENSKEVNGTCDVYGIGATLYHMVTGLPPRDTNDFSEALRRIEEEPTPPRRRNENIAKDLESIILVCMARELCDRYKTALEVAEDLERFLRGEPVRARPLRLVKKSLRWCQRNPKLAIAGSLALIFLIATCVALGFALVKLEQTRQAERRSEVSVWHSHGNSLLADENFAGAIESFHQAKALDPRNTENLNDLAKAHHSKGDRPAAIVAYNEVIAVDPGNAHAWHRLGVVRAEMGDFPGAAAAYRKALEFDPNNAETWNNLAWLLHTQADYAAAIPNYQKALALVSDYAQARRSLADAQERLALDKRRPGVLQGDPASFEDLVTLAEICNIRKDYLATTQLYARAAQVNQKWAEDLGMGHRYEAALAAALAADGKARDGDKLKPEDRTDLRAQALSLLQAELAARAKLLTKNPAQLHDDMEKWQNDPDLACLRDQNEIAKLPGNECDALKRLWGEVLRLAREAESCYVLTLYNGQLGRKERKQFYPITMTVGRTYVIDMKSVQFDTSLQLRDAQGTDVVKNDDIGRWPNTNSQIFFTAPADGNYLIVATSPKQLGIGAYTVTIREFGK